MDEMVANQLKGSKSLVVKIAIEFFAQIYSLNLDIFSLSVEFLTIWALINWKMHLKKITKLKKKFKMR